MQETDSSGAQRRKSPLPARKTKFVITAVGGVLLLAAGVMAAAWAWNVHSWRVVARQRVYRIGIDRSPPNHDWTLTLGAFGFSVDVLNEAAERAGVKLEWVYRPQGAAQALSDGSTDLWPDGYYRPEGTMGWHQSRPWSAQQHGLLWRKGTMPADPVAWSGQRIAVMERAPVQAAVALLYPGLRIVPVATRLEAARALCRMEVEVALVDLRSLEVGLLDRPKECAGKPLEMTTNAKLSSPVSLLATEEASGVAELLRSRIEGMIEDGRLLAHAEKWFTFSVEETRQVLALQRQNGQLRLLIALCAGMAAAIGLLAWAIRKLRAARRAADQARQSQSEFLVNVSHEIRTPMNGVMGTTELLLDVVEDREIRRHLETIKDSATNQLEVLNQLLDQSKIDSGLLQLEVKAFSPRRLVEQVERTFQPFARRKGILLCSEIPADLPSAVRGDGFRIRQVLTNLVNNALKFTDSGSVKIAVSWKGNGNKVEMLLSVTDTGIGIPKPVEQAIFEKFRQVDASTTRRFGGTGLGLSISKELVRLMGGDLRVESRPGEGSRFEFCVLVEVSPEELSENVPTEQAAVEPGLRVLLAEDNLVNQRVAEALLRRMGAHVVVAGNGAEAVTLCRDGNFDVVLMDCLMPEMDGYQATRAIRGLDGPASSIPIVALTAGVSREERRKAADAGMDGFIGKPLNRQELASTLAAIPRGAAS